MMEAFVLLLAVFSKALEIVMTTAGRMHSSVLDEDQQKKLLRLTRSHTWVTSVGLMRLQPMPLWSLTKTAQVYGIRETDEICNWCFLFFFDVFKLMNYALNMSRFLWRRMQKDATWTWQMMVVTFSLFSASPTKTASMYRRRRSRQQLRQ